MKRGLWHVGVPGTCLVAVKVTDTIALDMRLFTGTRMRMPDMAVWTLLFISNHPADACPGKAKR